MNQITIEFKNAKDLAKKIAEYNELMNGKPEPVEVEKPVKVVEVVAVPKDEVKPEAVEAVVEKPVEVEEPKKPTPGAKVEKEIVENISIEPSDDDLPVTDFDGNEINQPTEELSIDEVEVFDPKEFWNEFKAWMGSDKERAMAALKIFQSNGVAKPTSTALTDVIVKELKELMK
jgi:putative beta-N-acetylhexosaminidase